MDFGIDKCAMLAMKTGKVTKVESITLQDGREIRALEEGGSYKYLGILEMDRVMHEVMTKSLCKEYFRRTWKLLQLISGINTWAVSLLRYST